ncbi:MAG: hypothetical protein IPJ65_37475 [Archangiaceae bacterium]|nr:hypothetical protein [Archangiaceae bacterium]
MELTAAVRGEAYEAQLEATGGAAPLAWSLSSGSQLAPGLRLGEAGKLSGMPQAAGRFTFSVDVGDARGARASAGYLLEVTEPGVGPARSSCESPIELDLSSGLKLVEGTYADAEDLHQLSCGSSPAREHVFTFTLTEPADVELADSGLGGSAPTRHALRATCAGGGELACSVDAVRVHRLAAGRWYLFVEDALGRTEAAYSVFVRRLPATPPPANDTCAAAAPITFTAGVANLTGTRVGAVHDSVPAACSGDQEADVWFSLPIAVASRISLSAGVEAELFSGACGALAPQACLVAAECHDVELPGTQLLRVFGREEGFTAVVTREELPPPPANDRCDGASPIPLQGGSGSVSGQLFRARNDITLPCGPPGKPDAVHQLTLTQRSDVKLAVDAPGTQVAVGFASGACTAPHFLACGTDSGASVRGWALEPGTYPVWVEGSSNGSCWKGEYTLEATVKPSAPAPANDTCAAATDVSFSNGVAVIDGALVGAANDDEAPGCQFGTRASGPDVFYRLTLAQSARLRIIPTQSYPELLFHLAAGCGASSTSCSNAGYNPGVVETALLAAGTYYLVVDGDSDFSANPSRAFQLLIQQF